MPETVAFPDDDRRGLPLSETLPDGDDEIELSREGNADELAHPLDVSVLAEALGTDDNDGVPALVALDVA